jgi:ubiquinone/menaquinone biosynthesis C-methylase UbiE
VWTRFLGRLIPERIPWFAARLYDRLAGIAIDSYYGKVAAEITEHLGRGRILDVGTGPGYLPVRIAETAPEIEIEGVDLSRRLIGMARRRAEEAGVSDRVRFRTADANRLPFLDDSFDMVISTGSFHAWKNPVRVMNECRRVLKRGCEAWIYDPAQILTKEALDEPAGSMSLLERIAWKWGTFTSKAARRPTDEEIHGMIAGSEFFTGRVDRTGWLRIRLQK